MGSSIDFGWWFAAAAVVVTLGAGAAQAAPKAPACDRAHFLTVIDVGHSGESPGATSARGIPEYDFNLRLAQKIEDTMRAAGFAKTVLLITDGPAVPSLIKRVMVANQLGAQLFVSIHHDSVPEAFIKTWAYEDAERRYNDEFHGHSIFVSYENKNRTASQRIARLIGLQLRQRGLRYTPHYTHPAMGSRKRELIDPQAGVYRFDKLAVLRATRMPAVLLEAGSIINRDEELEASSPERMALVSAAVTAAVDDFCASVTAPREPPKSPPPATVRAGVVSR